MFKNKFVNFEKCLIFLITYYNAEKTTTKLTTTNVFKSIVNKEIQQQHSLTTTKVFKSIVNKEI